MNVLIIYSSKYGCTKECARYLAFGLPSSVTLANIDKTDFNDIGLAIYDTVIFGSSIYIGKISRKMRKFCTENMDLLREKRVGIFLCCAFSEQAKEYLAANFPAALLKSAVVIKAFGGEARTEKMNIIYKLIMKIATKGNHEKLKISQEDMDSFIKEMTI